ncbi:MULTISPECIES: MaoC family dehydratase [Mameliella]|uniref:Chain A, (R)-hydratase n=1 Tax=Mameliella alba TaxID=561184 RepID=A0A0B3RUA7_9RHOB|nr:MULTISPECIES: MaoC/PaaZ C-terminal domain-containing protein [Mameliella]KHQ51682.1 Chain A, (R)-hydratase [Mameliella alba]MDD9728970.1 MaoC/PaaZ C-terminal domain-containing protein [Mameliella sp. AT18]OWV40970.1 hydratase [Mameliella alba]OWV46266.1 hydratase [Mameliella alba]OWV60597.1 hydratase [Mameliella alba]
MLDLTATWTPTQAEFNAFAKVSGDDNAIHVDEAFSARTAFGRTVSHGMLIYAKFWGLLKQHRPEARQVTQSMMFPNPAFAGEEITLNIRETTPGQLSLRAIRAEDGAEVLIGETEIA